jgi:hypothetical protein
VRGDLGADALESWLAVLLEEADGSRDQATLDEVGRVLDDLGRCRRDWREPAALSRLRAAAGRELSRKRSSPDLLPPPEQRRPA